MNFSLFRAEGEKGNKGVKGMPGPPGIPTELPGNPETFVGPKEQR